MNHNHLGHRRSRVVAVGCAVILLSMIAPRGRATAPAGRYAVLTQDGVSVVADSKTQLVWQRAVPPCSLSWRDARTYCASLGTDWRLPSLEELQSIVDDTTSNPAIDATAFPNTPVGSFWTLSQLAANPASAGYVDFRYGFSFYADVALTYRLRCVR